MELSKYLLPSHSVEVTVTTKDEQGKANELILKTIIEQGVLEDQFKIVAPIYHGKIYNFQLGEMIQITFSTPDKLFYGVNCLVKERHYQNNLSTLTLKIAGSPIKIQRRKAFRVNIYNTYPFSYKGQEYEMVTKDISSTGMLALSTIQLPNNTVFEITFDANPKPKGTLHFDYLESKVFKVRCKVLDSMAQTEIRRYLNRIQFEGLNEQESQLLIQYLYAKQTEILHMDPGASQKITAYFESMDYNSVDTSSKEYRRLQIMSLISIVSLFVSLVMLLFSRPKKMYVLDYFFDFYRPQFWRQDYLAGAFIAAVFVAIFDLVGLGLNLIEIKKTNTTLHWSLLVSLIISLSIIAFVLIITSINKIPLF